MKDEIVDEIHEIREELAKRFDYDVRKMLDHVRLEQEKSGRNVVSPRKGKEKPGTGRDAKKVA